MHRHFFPPDIVNPCCQNYSVLKGFLPIKFKFTGHGYWMSSSTGIQVKVKQDFLSPFILQLLCQISSLCASTEGFLYPLASDWFSHVEANSCRLEEGKTVRLENTLHKLALCHYWDVLSRNPFHFQGPNESLPSLFRLRSGNSLLISSHRMYSIPCGFLPPTILSNSPQIIPTRSVLSIPYRIPG